jgi:hypothetical protein
MIKIKADLWGRNPYDLYSYVRGIQVTLAAAAPYAAITPTPAQVNAALLVLNDLNSQMTARMPVRVQRDDARRILINLVNQQVAQVNIIGNGDAQILGESGYPFTKPRQPAVVPGPIASISGINRGAQGRLVFRWSGSDGARCYMLRWSYTPELPGSFVEQTPIFGNSTAIAGYAPGQLVSAQVKGLNGADEGPWSDLVQVRVI